MGRGKNKECFHTKPMTCFGFSLLSIIKETLKECKQNPRTLEFLCVFLRNGKATCRKDLRKYTNFIKM